MQRLPEHIREELQAIAVKKSGILRDSVQRFWIQAECDVQYEQTYYRNFFGRTNENIAQFYLGDNLKMCVKTHRMKYDEKGNLIDDQRDSESDQSAEAEFARVFTKYYDEIGEYFPEFLRLKELLKLGVLSRIIQGRYESQRELAPRIENDRDLDDYLTNIKQKISHYPTGSNETDEKILNAISKSLCKQFYCKKEKAKLKPTIEKLHFYYDDDSEKDSEMSNNSTQCSWVSAAFSSELNMKVYGGVQLSGKLKETQGLKEKHEKDKSITKEVAIDLIRVIDKIIIKKQADEKRGEEIAQGNDVVLGYIKDNLKRSTTSGDDGGKVQKIIYGLIAEYLPTDTKKENTPNYFKRGCGGNVARKEFENLSGTPIAKPMKGKTQDVKLIVKDLNNGQRATLRPSATTSECTRQFNIRHITEKCKQ
ncbi:unnamed protein product [Didymodactylos carnosus]|uniref:Uncharacterized protein n=1 Tax=Didymodactylos carnosus TaxID=1234261 RepID=A0A815ED53_9BILA|nr:unnamed protein product [Didymodactylos carnosus]CAF4152933.1 unnamed protein product [Didymodactylos carnosus]